jgi:sugar/nucleoside kinase (ribokinase family)
VEEILALCDVAILSHSYPRTLHGEDYRPEWFVRDLARRMPDAGRRIAGLTLGTEGALLAAGGGEPIRVPGIALAAAEVLDTTGAGDVFHGAFIFELLRGRPAGDACRFANAAAALKCLGLTGRATLPPAGEIRRVAAAGRL